MCFGEEGESEGGNEEEQGREGAFRGGKGGGGEEGVGWGVSRSLYVAGLGRGGGRWKGPRGREKRKEIK